MDQTVGAWIVGIILIVVQLVITTVVGLIIKTKWDKRQKEKEELEELREKQRTLAENNRCEIVKRTIADEMSDMKKEFKEDLKNVQTEFKADIQPLCDDIDKMKKTMQKDTRRSLRQDARTYIKRGWVTGQEKTEYDELYWCYHNLGKNGVVDSDHEKVMNLPEDAEGE